MALNTAHILSYAGNRCHVVETFYLSQLEIVGDCEAVKSITGKGEIL